MVISAAKRPWLTRVHGRRAMLLGDKVCTCLSLLCGEGLKAIAHKGEIVNLDTHGYPKYTVLVGEKACLFWSVNHRQLLESVNHLCFWSLTVQRPCASHPPELRSWMRPSVRPGLPAGRVMPPPSSERNGWGSRSRQKRDIE